MLTRLLVNRLLVNIAYMKIWVHLTFVQKVSLEPCTVNCLVTNILQDMVFCVQQKKATHTGLEQVESE